MQKYDELWNEKHYKYGSWKDAQNVEWETSDNQDKIDAIKCLVIVALLLALVVVMV